MKDYTTSQIERLISEHIHSDRDQLIMRLRLIHGWTYERIAAYPDIDMSPRHISRIITRRCAQIEKYL